MPEKFGTERIRVTRSTTSAYAAGAFDASRSRAFWTWVTNAASPSMAMPSAVVASAGGRDAGQCSGSRTGTDGAALAAWLAAVAASGVGVATAAADADAGGAADSGTADGAPAP